MREIKFRAWDKSSKKMGMIQVRQILIPDGNNEHGNQELSVSHLKFGTNPSHWLIAPPLMQYTGLKDSHNKEEYFADIIREEDGTIRIIEDGCSAVLFRNPQVTLDIKYFWELKQHGIIGNIYENPEILKGEKWQ
ncbi:unnamed protein product [marine sediment metagenome]|uniref:YopX protein domain-containing protein n=1 Tax=marine sediment metagenome TaxID=412755 RepID=X1FYD4_9ZZZZ